MALLKNLYVSALAALLGGMPYLAFCIFAFTGEASAGGAPAQGALVIAGLVAIGIVLAWIFLTLSRISWRERGAVVREHLFGWPIGIASLAFVVCAVPAALGGFAVFSLLLVVCALCGAAGVGAAKLWMKLLY